MTKTCIQCNKTKDTSEFHKHNDHKDGLQDVCKECNISNFHSYYLITKSYILEQKKNGCIVTGELDPTKLHYHHLRDKIFGIGSHT